MNVLTGVVARVLFGLPMIVFGIFHFMNGGDMAGYVPSYVPGGVIWVYITGVALLAAGVSIIARVQSMLASLLLALLLIIFVLTIHLPAVAGGDMAAMPNLLKDLGLAGGALAFAGIFSADGS